MTDNPEYKDYSIKNIEEWLSDAMESGCTPNEIYSSMVDTVKKSMRYHKACYDDSVRLLTLLRGNKNSNIKVHDRNDTHLMELQLNGMSIGRVIYMVKSFNKH